MRSSIFAVVIAGICAATLGVPPGYADCPLNGTWKAKQADGYTVVFKFKQKGDKLSGTAKTKGMGGTADLDGFYLNEGHIEWNVYWPNGVIGTYSGRIDSRRRFKGQVWVDGSTKPNVEFHFLTRVLCD